MSMVRVLGKKDVESLISMPMAIEAVERAYLAKGKGQGLLWPMVFHIFGPDHRADLDIKSGNLEGSYGLKVVSWFGENASKNLPTLQGTQLLFDMSHGEPLALLNAGPVTDYRTGAAAAVGAKYLARGDARNLVVVGCGALAPYVIAAFRLVFPGLERMTIVNPHNPAHAAQRLSSIALQAEKLASLPIPLKAEEDVEGAVREADIVVTITPSTSPVVKGEWVHEGMHFSCIGADMEGKRELEGSCLSHAHLFCDDRGQSLSVGEFEMPSKEGAIQGELAEIGEVMAGAVQGRKCRDDITIFDSTGIALQDVAMAEALYSLAGKSQVGVTVEL